MIQKNKHILYLGLLSPPFAYYLFLILLESIHYLLFPNHTTKPNQFKPTHPISTQQPIMKPKFKFGKHLLSSFMFQPGFIPVNSGSFGSCPTEILMKKREYQDMMYRNQQKWQRGVSEQILKNVRRLTSEIIKAPFDNVFVVENSSTGGNAFLKSFKWEQGDTILASNITYKSIDKAVEYMNMSGKINVLKVDFTKQSFKSKESVLQAYKDVVEKHRGPIKLALLDHTSSTPMVIFPIQEITNYFAQKSIPFFVDGAHGFGQVDIDISKIRPAGYISNYHKWGFAPVSSAFLYVSPEYINKIYPSITANYHGQSKDREFFWQGTRDISSFCAIPEAIQYLQLMRRNGMQQYCQSLCLKVTSHLCHLLSTQPFTTNPQFTKYMNNIQLPVFLPHLQLLKISNYMLKKHNFFPVFYNFDNKSYWRISIQIYSEMEDFTFAGERLKEVFDEIKRKNLEVFNVQQ